MYIIKQYWTLEDVYKLAFPLESDLLKGPFSAMNNTSTDNTIIDFFNNVLVANSMSSIDDDTLKGNAYLDTMWKYYLYPKFWNRIVCYTEYEDDTAINGFTNSIGAIYTWLKASTDRYSLLIANLESNKEKLLDSVKRVSESRFNDTPQTETGYNDVHNSTITKNVEENEFGTLMSRINEIEDNLKELYLEWSNEFRKYIYWSV